MGCLVANKNSGEQTIEVSVKELTLRLRSIESVHNMEIVKLAIESMLDEIKDAVDMKR